MITISSREVGKWLTKIDRKIVRTYKGEIERSQVGSVVKFPASFVTIGFDLEWTGPREELKLIQQLLLASDVFLFAVYQVRDNDLKGDFSATSCEMEDLSDKKEEYSVLMASIVNVDNLVKDHNGNKFGIKLSSNATAVVSGCFGETVTVPSGYRSYQVQEKRNGKKQGYLPEKVVLLGDIWISS